MTMRPGLRREDQGATPSRARKDFDEVAERVFRDDSPGTPMYGDILDDEPADEAA